MRHARVGREVVAKMVKGQIQVSGKEFLITEVGTFRMAVAHNSDNSTEAEAHEAMGARTFVMTDDEDMLNFFELHGMTPGRSLIMFRNQVRARMYT
jgi:hypothetical protein